MRPLIRLSRSLLTAVLLLAAAANARPATAQVGAVPIQILETPLNPLGNAYEINTAPDGALWVSDYYGEEIRRYAPDGSQVQVYTGVGNPSDARPDASGKVWYVEMGQGQLSRLTPGVHPQVELWDLPDGSIGYATALDGQGRVWVSDPNVPSLFRFDPQQYEMCVLDLSSVADWGSYYLAVDGNYLWLGTKFSNAVLRLNTITNQLTGWNLDPQVWHFESDSFTGDGDGGLWFSDSFSNSLAHLDFSDPVQLHLLRYSVPAGGPPRVLAREDSRLWFSGDAATLGRLIVENADHEDYSPSVFNEVLSPNCSLVNSTTKSVDMGTPSLDWTPVDRSLTYPQPGWMLMDLGIGSSPWGLSWSGSTLWVVDQGAKKLLRVETTSVSVCKLSDVDGNPGTDADRSALPGWSMMLFKDDVQVGSALTGSDGCYTWDFLLPGAAYTVKEGMLSGWLALTPTSHDFGVAQPGGVYQHTFINAEGSQLYLPMIVK